MSRLALLAVLLLGCLAASSVPAEAAVAPVVAGASEPELAIPGLGGEGGGEDDEEDAEMEVVDLNEVLESRAAEEDGAVGTQWKNPLKKLKCKGSKCRRKCNAKAKNGACAGPVCVCWR